MNVKKTIASVVVWYDANTGKVSLAKCSKTGKFVSLAVAQGLLNVELKAIRLPSVNIVKVDYSFLAMKDFLLCILLLACLAVLVGLPIGLIVAKLAGCDNLIIENIMVVKAAFVAWFVSIVIVSTAGNK